MIDPWVKARGWRGAVSASPSSPRSARDASAVRCAWGSLRLPAVAHRHHRRARHTVKTRVGTGGVPFIEQVGEVDGKQSLGSGAVTDDGIHHGVGIRLVGVGQVGTAADIANARACGQAGQVAAETVIRLPRPRRLPECAGRCPGRNPPPGACTPGARAASLSVNRDGRHRAPRLPQRKYIASRHVSLFVANARGSTSRPRGPQPSQIITIIIL